jgi:hypothetical protein
MEGHFFQFCYGFGYQHAALLLDGNQNDSFTLKGGLDKPPPQPAYSRKGVKCCD